MRRLILFLIIITALILAAIVYFSPTFFRHFHIDNFIKEAIANEIGRPVDFDYLQIRFFPALTLTIKNFSIHEKAHFKEAEIVRVGTAALRVSIVPLLFKRLEIEKFIFSDVSLALRERDGKFNIKALMVDHARQAAEKSRGKSMDTAPPAEPSEDNPLFDVVVSELLLKNATITYIKLDQFGEEFQRHTGHIKEGHLKDVGFSQPIKFEITGTPMGEANYVVAEGTFSVEAADALETLSIDAHIGATDFNVCQVFVDYFPSYTCPFEKGISSFQLNVKKNKGEKTIGLAGDIEIAQCVIPIMKTISEGPEELDCQLGLDIVFELPLLSLQVNKIKTSFGATKIKAEGMVHFKDQVIDARLYSTHCSLNDVPVIGAMIIKSLPPQWGVGGDFAFDVSLKGNYFKQNVKGVLDFTASNLAFGDIYNKPVSFPLVIESDFDMESFRSLSGPLSMQLGAVTLHGDIRDFDIKNKEGEFTFLTNKFGVEAFREQVLFLSDFDIVGRAKVHCNAKGRMTDLDNSEFNIGITLDDINVRKEPLFIRNFDAFVSIDQYTIEVSEAEGYMYDSYLKGWARAENYREKPIINFDIFSPHLDINVIAERLENQSGEKKDSTQSPDKASRVPANRRPRQRKPSNKQISKLKDVSAEGAFYFSKMAYRNTLFEEVKGVVQMSNGVVHLESIDGKGWSGKINAGGSIDLVQQPYAYQGMIDVDNINLEDLFVFIQGADYKDIVDGTLDFDMQFTGKGFTIDELERHLQGEGMIEIRNGELKKVDILAALSAAKQLFKLKDKAYGGTRFNDITTSFLIDKGKFMTDEVVLQSDDFTIEGGGFISVRGDLNYAIDVYLSRELARSLFTNINPEEIITIPVTITGTVDKPHYSVAGGFVRNLVNNLIEEGIKDLFDRTEGRQDRREGRQDRREVRQEQSRSTKSAQEGTVITDEDVPAQTTPTQRSIGDGPQETTPPTESPTTEELLQDAISMGLDLLLKKEEK